MRCKLPWTCTWFSTSADELSHNGRQNNDALDVEKGATNTVKPENATHLEICANLEIKSSNKDFKSIPSGMILLKNNGSKSQQKNWKMPNA